MGELLGSVPFLRPRLLWSIAALALIWSGLATVRSVAAVNDAVLLAAGDIAGCDHEGDTATATLVEPLPGTVATLGDAVYNSGTAAQFAECYDPTWGRFKDRTRPAVGNHEYRTPGAAGYFDYFGDQAGPRGQGWYSYDLGDWHVVVLNSNCAWVSCEEGSEQHRWLRADLAAHSRQCTLAYWHHPRFSSDDRHGDWPSVAPFWDALYEYGVELVLSGHAHVYERFAPQTPAGVADPDFGIRQFVVGTGGAGPYGFRAAKPNSEVRNAGAHGVLSLTLRPDGYDWLFLPQAGQTFTDAGSSTCHRPATIEETPTTTTMTGPAVPPTTAPPAVSTSSSTTTTTRRRPTRTAVRPGRERGRQLIGPARSGRR